MFFDTFFRARSGINKTERDILNWLETEAKLARENGNDTKADAIWEIIPGIYHGYHRPGFLDTAKRRALRLAGLLPARPW